MFSRVHAEISLKNTSVCVGLRNFIKCGVNLMAIAPWLGQSKELYLEVENLECELVFYFARSCNLQLMVTCTN